jgi:Cu(I)/Ag(I) efflux system membrane fusion protein/cobalt-zinc-cadmium efflux system membrane fusion protein
MKRQIALVIGVAAVAALAGWLTGRLSDGRAEQDRPQAAPGREGPCAGGAQPLYWKAPMDPTYIRNEPGKSPMGMDLVPECPEGAGHAAGGVVHIDPVLAQNMGVKLARVARRDLSRTIRAVGRVAYDERRVAHVHTKVQGWVEKLHIDYEGQLVERGQPLLEIYSPELVATQEELLVAARYRDQTSASPFEDVEKGGANLFEATRRRLELWDIPDRDIDRLLETGTIRKHLTLYSPAKGVVTHLMVREGMEVGPNENLYTIADLSRVWVYADVYEYELPWIAVGQQGIVELSYLPGTAFEGAVTYVYPYLDSKTRTVRVRLELDNPDLALKPDMFANVRIQAQTRHGTLAVPDEAVLRSGQRSLVIVALEGGRFDPRQVTLGIDSGDGWLEVLQGLEEGERIVTSGQFLIDSESRLREAAQKFLEPNGAERAMGETPDHTGHEMHEMPAAPDHTGHEMHEMPAMPDHSGHEMHEMPVMPDHSGHEMPAAPDHTGHEMPGAADHSGHAAPAAEE